MSRNFNGSGPSGSPRFGLTIPGAPIAGAASSSSLVRMTIDVAWRALLAASNAAASAFSGAALLPELASPNCPCELRTSRRHAGKDIAASVTAWSEDHLARRRKWAETCNGGQERPPSAPLRLGRVTGSNEFPCSDIWFFIAPYAVGGFSEVSASALQGTHRKGGQELRRGGEERSMRNEVTAAMRGTQFSFRRKTLPPIAHRVRLCLFML